ncbi:MAG: heme-binding protein [Verrucomicrobiaceae bacterium]
MKALLIPALAILASCSAPADNGPAAYSSEAPLPKGWPTPGPFNEVALKEYPTYRAAFTPAKGTTMSFWRLFGHIKKKDIPMTAPVEMTMEKDDPTEMTAMAFLYQDTTVGTPGKDGEKVEVRDVPKTKALTYAWMGARNDDAIEKAKAAIEKTLAEKKLIVTGYRVLGYNGPGTPKAKRTHELQALLK